MSETTVSAVVLVVVLVVLVLAAAVAVWVAYRAGTTRGRLETQAELAAARTEADGLREHLGELRAIEGQESHTLQALGPLRETIGRVAEQVNVLERDRQQQYGRLGEQLMQVTRATTGLQSETATLAGALRSSTVRGVWGEAQLRRVLELSGLEKWCDFDEQVRAVTAAGQEVRPDVVVTLPGGKSLVIDAKVPLDSYLEAQSTLLDEADRAELLNAHAQALRQHVRGLAAKEYWTALPATPEMVVCFVPGDAILAAALDARPELYEEALASKVVLASPATLFALARTVAYVWKQDALSRNATELLALGTELHSRIRTLGGHLGAMGSSLTTSVTTYNKLVGALENRVLVTARKFGDLGITGAEIAEVRPLDSTTRPLTAPELLEPSDAVDSLDSLDSLGTNNAGTGTDN